MGVTNAYVPIPKLNATHCNDEVFCPAGYECYKPASYKFARFCYPTGLDPSQDLSHLLDRPPISTTLLYCGTYLLMALILALQLAQLWLTYRRTGLPRQHVITQRSPPVIKAWIKTPKATATDTMGNGPPPPPAQYSMLPPGRPISSPHFPRHLVPDHLANDVGPPFDYNYATHMQTLGITPTNNFRRTQSMRTGKQRRQRTTSSGDDEWSGGEVAGVVAANQPAFNRTQPTRTSAHKRRPSVSFAQPLEPSTSSSFAQQQQQQGAAGSKKGKKEEPQQQHTVTEV